jgi:hypothetical protein
MKKVKYTGFECSNMLHTPSTMHMALWFCSLTLFVEKDSFGALFEEKTEKVEKEWQRGNLLRLSQLFYTLNVFV